MVSQEIAERLNQFQPFEVRVSFEGPERIHDNIRGKNSYKRALKGLKNLTAAGLMGFARITLNSLAENELEPLFFDLSAAGATKLKASVIKKVGNASLPENKDLLGYAPSRENAKFIQDLGSKYGISVELSSEDFNLDYEYTKDLKLRYESHKNCGAGFENAYISPQGDVFPCSTMPYASLGNIRASSFLDVWKGYNANRYRDLALKETERKLCKSRSIEQYFLHLPVPRL